MTSPAHPHDLQGLIPGLMRVATVLTVALSCSTTAACHEAADDEPIAERQLAPIARQDRPAFPGAEGHGRFARGGRDGRIIPVTTLADEGSGSLRACIEAAGPRVCVFRVAGVIRYIRERPIIVHPNLTIAGETAPGDGILITHSGGESAFTPLVVKNTHDVVVRHIRVRTDLPGEQRGANSAFIIENSRNVILDHVSASWALDENVGGYGSNDTITISASIFAEGVPRHDKCALLASDPKGPQRLSFIRNLCAHNGDRNPDVNFPPGSCVEVINNVLYNASSQFTEVWESYGGTPANIVGNYYRQGPSTAGRAYAIDRPLIGSSGRAHIYQTGNVIDGDRVIFAPVAAQAFVDAPVCPLESTVLDARAAYAQVLDGAGAFPRDPVDARIVDEVRSRTGKIGRDNRVLPALRDGDPYGDADGDGMSDAWELRHGLDPRRNDAWGDVNGNGWANLEEFLNYAHETRLVGRSVR
jgi:hypothetical protein